MPKTVQETAAYIWLKNKCEGTAKEGYLKQVTEAATFLEEELKKTDFYFKSYTKHDLEHSCNVLDHMFDLIKYPTELSEEECMLIIYSALFHDVGMAKDGSYKAIIKDTSIYKSVYKKSTISDEQQREEYAVRECIRIEHGKLAHERIYQLPALKINNDFVKSVDLTFSQIFTLKSTDGVINGFSLVDLLAKICRSHQESVVWIQNTLPPTINVPGNGGTGVISPQYVAYLLRIADLLDIDCKRAPQYYEWVRTVDAEGHEHYITNQTFSTAKKVLFCGEKSCVNNNCEVKQTGKDCPKDIPTIYFEGYFRQEATDGDDELRCKVYEYQNYLEKEIKHVNAACCSFSGICDRYALKICESVINRISDPIVGAPNVLPQVHLDVDYDVIKSIFLGEKLYTDKMAGMRELIQNCYDACKAMKHSTSPDDLYTPIIRIIWDEANEKLKIRDNGIGMSKLEISEYFLNIGKSKYNHNSDYVYGGFHPDHIGHYGIGFFATFMLSDDVKVITRNRKSNLKYTVKLKKARNYAFLKEEADNLFQGTTIELSLENVKEVFDNPEILKQYIESMFLEDGISVSMTDGTTSTKLHLKSLSEQFVNALPGEMAIDLSHYFNDVDAIVYYRKRKNAIIATKNFIYDGNDITEIGYHDLLTRVSGRDKILYLNFPQEQFLFNIFIDANGNSDIDTSKIPASKRLDYSIDRDIIPNQIPIKLSRFCQENSIATFPNYADVKELHLEFSGANRVVVKNESIVCRIASAQSANDSCGTRIFDGIVYIRDVLVPEFKFTIPFVDEEYEPISIYANIKTADVFPSLDRKSIDNNTSREFAFAIGKALSLAIIDSMPGNAYKQELIVDRLYEGENRFFKSKNEGVAKNG